MRVLLVSNTYPPADLSGVGTLAWELARRLDAAGHHVRVLTRRPPPGDPYTVGVGGPKVLFPLLAALRFLTLGAPRAVGRAPGDDRGAEGTTAGSGGSWDLVHVHESDGALVAVLLRLLRALHLPKGRARLLATLQVSYVEEQRALRPVRADGEVVSWPTASEKRFARWRAPLLARLGRLTARLADAVIAPSAQTAAELRRDYGVASVEVIPNGVALPEPGPPLPGEAAPVIFFAGRLRSRKGVAVLLAALPKVLSRVPGCRLVIAGDGEQRAAIEQAVRARGLERSVELLGTRPRDEIAVRLATADVFCLPSTYEGMPLAILEAMAAGVPVVATAVSGNPEAVEDGVSGLLVPPESAAALASALIALLLDPARRHRLAEAARRRVEERFTIERIAEQHLELLRRLLRSRG